MSVQAMATTIETGAVAGGVADAHVDRLAEWLLLTLGPRLTAFASGAHDPGEVDRVAHGVAPDAGLESRLRNLYAVTSFLSAEDGPGSAHDWLVERNPELDDRSPAALLHDGAAPEAVWMAAASSTF